MEGSLLKCLYRDSLSLLTDLYEITMAYSYWKEGLQDDEAVFHLFFRKYPFGGAYALAAGAQVAIEFIEQFSFADEDLTFLTELKDPSGGPLFEVGFIEYLRGFRLEVDVDAMEEGTPVFPNQPLIRVKGPLIAAQILESALLNILNFHTLIATKASRIRFAAKDDHVVEFGLRRAQGIDGAVSATRASYIGGCDSTSNVLAGKLFGIPVVGTIAHSYVMTYDTEEEAFSAFARSLPKNCIFLIDTYDSIRGVERAISVAKKEGIQLRAVRLDSGDLLELSKEVQKKLDAAGLHDTKIMATNELTEQIIEQIKQGGGKISIWGVGTNLVTAKDQPALDGVYKLSAVKGEGKEWKYRLKLSEQELKTTNPGISQVRRYFDETGYVADMLFDEQIGPGEVILKEEEKQTVQKSWHYKDLLVPMLRKGKRVYPFPSLEAMRLYAHHELGQFPIGMRTLHEPTFYFSGIEENLYRKKCELMEEVL